MSDRDAAPTLAGVIGPIADLFTDEAVRLAEDGDLQGWISYARVADDLYRYLVDASHPPDPFHHRLMMVILEAMAAPLEDLSDL